jgi:hypothetical protein
MPQRSFFKGLIVGLLLTLPLWALILLALAAAMEGYAQ